VAYLVEGSTYASSTSDGAGLFSGSNPAGYKQSI
jgi:hypothetical protein